MAHLHSNCPIRVRASAEVMSWLRLVVGPKMRPQVAESSISSEWKKSKQLQICWCNSRICSTLTLGEEREPNAHERQHAELKPLP